MRRAALHSLVGASALVLGFVGVTAAQAEPDLVIQKTDSRVNFVSCEEGDPLVEGRIVIRNEGTDPANLRSVDDFFRSFVAVYVPENIDLIDKDTKRSKIEPGEQRAVRFSVGKGKVKKGRNYNAFKSASRGGLEVDKNALQDDEDLAESVQGFLKGRGYAVAVDGDWGPGSKRALAAFQKNTGLPGNGDWNLETAKKLETLMGTSSKVEVSNIKDDQGRTKITVFAVVDPYNLITETNEMNNILSYTGYLKCD